LAEDIELPDGWVAEPIVPIRSEELRAPRGGIGTSQPANRKGTVSEHRRDERERILDALRSCNWNRVKAAEVSGIPRRTFYRRLREYGIQ